MIKKIKNKLAVALTVIAFILTTEASYGLSIYVDALEMLTHPTFKKDDISIKVSIEYPINNNFDFGTMIGYTSTSKLRDFTNIDLYLDYNFGHTCNSNWFMRTLAGVSYSNKTFYTNTRDNLSYSNNQSYFERNKHGSFDVKGAKDVLDRSYIDKKYLPDFGIYIGKKIDANNGISFQILAGFSNVYKSNNNYSYIRIKGTDIIAEGIIKVGYNL